MKSKKHNGYLSCNNKNGAEPLPENCQDLIEFLTRKNCEYGSYLWDIAVKAYKLGMNHSEKKHPLSETLLQK